MSFLVEVQPKTPAHPFYCSNLPPNEQNNCSRLGYTFNGQEASVLTLNRNQNYSFEINTPNHPFYFTLDPVGAKGLSDPQSLTPQNLVTDQGVLNVQFNESFPNEFYYQCQNHPRMGGKVQLISENPGNPENPENPKNDRKEFLLQMAQLAQSYGFVPIPIKDKIPRFRGWQNVRFDPNDPQKNIRRIDHLYDANMANNLGIVTGEASNVVVLDVDQNSVNWFRELVRLNGGLPETFTVQTGNNGLHVYFKYDPRVAQLRNMNKIGGQDIDFRTTGGQAIFPGSISAQTGKMYQVLSGYQQNQPILAEMPDWLLSWLINNIK